MFPNKTHKNCVCNKSPGERIDYYIPALKAILKIPPNERAKIYKKATPCFMKFISECGLNILKGNIPLKEKQYEKLKPHKRMLLLLSKKNLSLKNKKAELVKKKGSGLFALIPILLSALSGFAGQALAKSVI